MRHLTIRDLDGLTTWLVDVFPVLEAEPTRHSLSVLLRDTGAFNMPTPQPYRRVSYSFAACAQLLHAIDRAAHDVDAFDAQPLTPRLTELRDHLMTSY